MLPQQSTSYGAMGQPMFGPMGQPLPAPKTQAHLEEEQRKHDEELLALCQRIYSDYAHWVRTLEDSTTHIHSKAIQHRQKYYWLPLQKYNKHLQDEHKITFEQLADIVNTGQRDHWPTQSTKDAEAIGRMLRRIPAERAQFVRRMQSEYDMAVLGAWCDAIIAQASASSVVAPGLPVMRVGPAGIHAPIHPDGSPAMLPRSFRFGPATYGTR
jgi:hypothetical protein